MAIEKKCGGIRNTLYIYIHNKQPSKFRNKTFVIIIVIYRRNTKRTRKKGKLIF